jgi:hypothetical protein
MYALANVPAAATMMQNLTALMVISNYIQPIESVLI